MMHSKPVPEELPTSPTIPEGCKVALAMAHGFTFALHLSRLQRSRSNRKLSLLRSSRLHLRHVDDTIRVWFRGRCRSSKQWPPSFFAITRCGNEQLLVR